MISNLHLSLCAALAALSACQTADIISFEQTHMLRLHCSPDPQTHQQSRIAVLDIGDPKFDYALAAGHGVPSGRPCVVLDFNGLTQDVDSIRFPKNYRSGEQTDWAVVRFPRMESSNLIRYKLEPIDDLESLDGREVNFARARGLPKNSQTCRLLILNFGNGRTRIGHDCKGIPGQSGSPVTQIIDGEHRLLGLNLGHLWMFKSPNTGRPDKKGYINLLDEETTSEIRTLIDQMR